MADRQIEAQSALDHFRSFGPVEAKPLTRFQQATARAMLRSWTAIPHVTHHDEAEITALDRRLKSVRRGLAEGPSLLACVIKACVATLQALPQFNATLDPEQGALLLKGYYNVGVAVDTPRGLVVPVVRNCDQKTPAEIASDIAAFSRQAREKGLPYAAVEGSSFTVSSLGSIGGLGFTPIINPPDVAILGIARAQLRPVFEAGGIRPALMLPLSLSYDHRVINGADAARFLVRLAAELDAVGV